MSISIKYWNWKAQKNMGLFDFSSSSDDDPRILLVSSSTSIYRHRLTYELCDQKKVLKAPNFKDYEEIMTIEKENGKFIIANVRESDQSQEMHENLCSIVTNIAEEPKLELKEKKVVKLGKVKLFVEKLHLSKKRGALKKTFYEDAQFLSIEPKIMIGEDYYSDSTNASTIEDAPTCRYCHLKSMSNENKFIAVCGCVGSSKYVHQQCMTEWIVQRCRYTERPEAGVYQGEKKGISCEICKEYIQQQAVLPCFQRDELTEYLIMRAVIDKEETVFVVDLGKSREITVGRKLSSHIVLDDPSVSRTHCILLWDSERGSLQIQDSHSKFGTLIKNSVHQIQEEVTLQRGRTKLEIKPVPKPSFINKAISGFIRLMKYDEA